MVGKSSQELRFLMLLSQDYVHRFLFNVPTYLKSFHFRFSFAASLPQQLIYAPPVTIDNMCYLLGGYTAGSIASKKVFSVCLNDLISQAVSQPVSASAPPTSSPWQSLPDTPMTSSTALAFNGALLAVGGRTAIYHY